MSEKISTVTIARQAEGMAKAMGLDPTEAAVRLTAENIRRGVSVESTTRPVPAGKLRDPEFDQ